MTAILYPIAGKRVFVAGHRGMVGSAIVRRLASEGCEILTVDRETIDLTRIMHHATFFCASGELTCGDVPSGGIGMRPLAYATRSG